MAGHAATLAQDLRALLSKLKRRLRDQSENADLTASQVSVLLRLEKEGPATTSNLARAEGMRPQSMSTLIAALESADLIAGSPDPADGRQTLLALTSTCRKWLETARTARQDWLTRALQSKLSAEEQRQVAKAVKLLERLVDD